MNILSYMNKVNAIGRYLLVTVFVLNLLSLGFAGSPLQSAMARLCKDSQTFLGIAVMVLIVLAGTVYAIGQVLGAETRARAAVWATAMLTGAVIGAVIYIVTPPILHALLPNLTNDGGDPCTFKS